MAARRRRIVSLFFLFGVSTAGVAGAGAEDLDLRTWEIGVGVVGLTVPDYSGSSSRQERVLPIPYFVYRGNLFSASNDGLHFLAGRRFELDLSFGADPPVSGDEGARAGMPDLLPAWEVGPSVNVVLAADEDRTRALKLRLAGRAVIGSDVLQWDWVGLVFAPELRFDAGDLGERRKAIFSVGPLLSQGRVHAYRYEVPAEQAAPDRPMYDARGGYGGIRAIGRVAAREGPLWMSLFARYDNLAGAVFADSPLVSGPHALTVGATVAWVFARSRRAAPR